jgi:hypothetical protein
VQVKNDDPGRLFAVRDQQQRGMLDYFKCLKWLASWLTLLSRSKKKSPVPEAKEKTRHLNAVEADGPFDVLRGWKQGCQWEEEGGG